MMKWEKKKAKTTDTFPRGTEQCVKSEGIGVWRRCRRKWRVSQRKERREEERKRMRERRGEGK